MIKAEVLWLQRNDLTRLDCDAQLLHCDISVRFIGLCESQTLHCFLNEKWSLYVTINIHLSCKLAADSILILQNFLTLTLVARTLVILFRKSTQCVFTLSVPSKKWCRVKRLSGEVGPQRRGPLRRVGP